MQQTVKDTKISREFVWLEAWKVIAVEAKHSDIASMAIHADKVLEEFDKRFTAKGEVNGK